MKLKYSKPELEVTKLTLVDILAASNDEVFVDGDGLFG